MAGLATNDAVVSAVQEADELHVGGLAPSNDVASARAVRRFRRLSRLTTPHGLSSPARPTLLAAPCDDQANRRGTGCKDRRGVGERTDGARGGTNSPDAPRRWNVAGRRGARVELVRRSAASYRRSRSRTNT